MYSNWLKIDLHMHSYKSNEIKPNDFIMSTSKSTEKDDYLTLLSNKLKDDDINLFSIVDHNIINFEVYDALCNGSLSDNKNFVCGIEMDISDSSISPDDFHLLIFFKKYEKTKLQDFIKNLHNKGKSKETKWTFDEVYSAMFEAKTSEFMMIPHYNSKSKSIAVKDIIKLNRPLTIFDAFEDGNNPTALSKSLQSYLHNGTTDFPTVAFSDWHNKPDDKSSCTRILGTLEEPFNSLKLSFLDPKMRVSLEGVSECRPVEQEGTVIEKINFNGKAILLSPYQNTIIGGYGSGKSLLGTLIRGDDELFNNKYEDYKYLQSSFSIDLTDGTNIESIKDYSDTEKEKINFYEMKQNSQLLMASELGQSLRDEISSDINIEFPLMEKNLFNNFISYFNSDKIMAIENLLTDLKENKNKDIQYPLLQNQEKVHTIVEEKLKSNDFSEISAGLDKIPVTIQDLRDYQILEGIYFVDDHYLEDDLIDISEKQKKVTSTVSNVEECFTKIDSEISSYNLNLNLKSEGKRHQLTRISDIKENIQNFITNLTSLKFELSKLENFFEEGKIKDELDNKKFVDISKSYKTVARFKKISQMKKTDEFFIKRELRKETLFKSFINTKILSKGLLNNQSFTFNFKKLKEEYEKCFTICYDIVNSENNDCILQKSPGGRAIMIMEIILELVEQLDQEKFNILFIDQPEDQLDNKNIYNIVVNRIRELKYKGYNLQIIFISHNANISIAADSENIIIAEKNSDFNYDIGSIESNDHAIKIADILEGGASALQQRGIKLNVNSFKESWD